jgi:hypothetical protein
MECPLDEHYLPVWTDVSTSDSSVIKISAGYPPACWREESGSPKGEAKAFAEIRVFPV